MNTATATIGKKRLKYVMEYVDSLEQEFIDKLRTDPDELISQGEMLKDGDRCTVVRLTRGDASYVLKRFNLKGKLHTFRHLPMRSRARWCWNNAIMLVRYKLPSPEPIAMVEERFGPFRMRSFFLSNYIEGDSLVDWIDSNETDKKAIHRIAMSFSEMWKLFGKHRIGHGDMKATNFIVDKEEKLWLVDIDGMRMHPSGPTFNRARERDMERFLRNWQSKPAVLDIFRARIDKA